VKGLMFFKNRIQIAENEELQWEISQREQERKVTGNCGQKNAPKPITRDFYRMEREEWINQYEQTNDIYQRMKLPCHTKFKLLQPLELSYSHCESPSVHFMLALPELEGHTQIMVVVD
jgi:hypothetical protein